MLSADDPVLARPAPETRPVRAVLLDAFGTLCTLVPPAPRLGALLSAEGHHHPEEAVAAALAAEIRYYRAHHDRGRDAASLAALRAECADVLAAHLGHDVPPPARLAELLVSSLRFRLLPDVVPALDALAARGILLAVASNWDCSLPDVLAELGVAERFALIATSAVAGARKPSPGLFHQVLDRLGVAGADALHCGDDPGMDCAGARQAGVPAVLIDREGRHPRAPCRRIRALTELAGLLPE